MRRSPARRVKSRSSKPRKSHPPRPALAPLLFSRGDTAELLRCSVATVRRMEARGLLDPMRPGGPGTPVRYRSTQVHALAGVAS